MSTRLFRKLPVVVEAVEWTGSNAAEVAAFTGPGRFDDSPPGDCGDPDVTAQVFDVLHSTWVGVKTGQWVIRGVKGELYPIDRDVLKYTYGPSDGPIGMGSVSDGYHSFSELYEHRTALFAALCLSHPDLSWRSRQHHEDGGPMYDGMFIAGLDLPAGQVTYHCEDDAWPLFDGVKTLDHAPVWDGHSPADVVSRLQAWGHALR